MAGTTMLGEGVDAPPPPHPRVNTRIDYGHTTAKACRRMIGKDFLQEATRSAVSV
jgi:hypothetical protein